VPLFPVDVLLWSTSAMVGVHSSFTSHFCTYFADGEHFLFIDTMNQHKIADWTDFVLAKIEKCASETRLDFFILYWLFTGSARSARDR